MRVYFMGICGTAMGNAAVLLQAGGDEVFGADIGVYPPMSEVLEHAGIPVYEGFDPVRLASLSPDLVVVGNAMSRGNPEVEWLLDQTEVAYTSLPQLLGERILVRRRSVVVAGTHGKTTTSTILAYLLNEAGEAPGWLIGGVPLDLPKGAHLGGGDAFVIEGDEYDSAFFDKRSKFIHYRPRIVLINNIEMDHADIFRDLPDVRRTFEHLTRIVPGNGVLIVNGDDPNIGELLPVPWTRLLRVGQGPENDLRIHAFADGPEDARFELRWQGRHWADVSWNLHGLFNARNAALAALGAAFAAGRADPVEFDLGALSAFQGVRRRQEVLCRAGGWTVIEDFAHHPTAVSGAIDALKAAYPDGPMTVCFEPRSNTASSPLFQKEFAVALSKADRVLLGAVHRAEKLAASARLDTVAIVRDLAAKGGTAEAFDSNQALNERLMQWIGGESGGTVVFFSNGSFDGIPRALAGNLRRKWRPA